MTVAAKANLKAIVDALEGVSDQTLAFFDLDTGEVYLMSLEMISEAEEGEEDSDESDEPDPEWELAKKIVTSDRILRLPTKGDIHESEIMNEFSESIRNHSLREELLETIQGAGAFRIFKSAIRRHHIEQEWYDFRAQALRDIAEEWCEDNGVAVE